MDNAVFFAAKTHAIPDCFTQHEVGSLNVVNVLFGANVTPPASLVKQTCKVGEESALQRGKPCFFFPNANSAIVASWEIENKDGTPHVVLSVRGMKKSFPIKSDVSILPLAETVARELNSKLSPAGKPEAVKKVSAVEQSKNVGEHVSGGAAGEVKAGAAK